MANHEGERTPVAYWGNTFAKTIRVRPEDHHGLICMLTREGKTRDFLAQLLLDFKGSCFVVAPKIVVRSSHGEVSARGFETGCLRPQSLIKSGLSI
jgi:hypothetical protein